MSKNLPAPTPHYSGHHTPEIPGQLAMIAVLDDTNNRMLAHRALPHGEARTEQTWDAVLLDLGYRRVSPWQPFVDRGHRCDVEPVSAVEGVEGGGDDV